MNRLVVAVLAGGIVFASCGSSDGGDDVVAEPTPAPTSTPQPPPEPTATPHSDPTVPPTPEAAVATPEARDLDLADPAVPAGDHPPGDADGIAALVDPMIADLGLRFTYGSLIDRSTNGTFAASPTGDHLAVYVEPVGEYSDAQYIENTWTLAARLTPFLFDNYPGLQSYDVCQEPRPAENDDAVPPPTTQLDIFRGPASAIDWENGSLATLIESNRDEPTTTLRLDLRLQQLPEFAAELDRVG